MKCGEIRESMPDLAAGLAEVTPQVDQHLRTCQECSGKLEEFRATMALLDEWKAPEPSGYFDTRFQARLREEKSKADGGWLRWVRKPAMALALAAVVVMSATLFRGGKSGTASRQPVVVAVTTPVEPGTAVGDLQALDKNQELYADFDVLDDLQVQPDVSANQ